MTADKCSRFDERGNASVALISIAVVIVVVWWIFMAILDGISTRHHTQRQENLKRFASFKDVPPAGPARRVPKGYTLRH